MGQIGYKPWCVVDMLIDVQVLSIKTARASKISARELSVLITDGKLVFAFTQEFN